MHFTHQVASWAQHRAIPVWLQVDLQGQAHVESQPQLAMVHASARLSPWASHQHPVTVSRSVSRLVASKTAGMRSCIPMEYTHFEYVFLGAFAKLRKAIISFVMSIRVCLSTCNNWTPTGQILMRFDIWTFFENLSRKFKFYYNRTRIMGTLHEDVFTFMTVSC